LEARISAAVMLYDAFADLSVWRRIEPRLITVQASILEALGDPADIMRMPLDKFEQLVAELLAEYTFDEHSLKFRSGPRRGQTACG